MAVTRRPLLTAAAAGTLLAALWFVPSANATDEPADTARTTAAGAAGPTGRDADASAARKPEAIPLAADASGEALADTGTGIDVTPYLAGGAALLGIGAVLVTHSIRRAGGPLSV